MPDPAPARSHRGLPCPACGLPLRAIRTRKAARNLIVRRRKCPCCGFRVTTEERPRASSSGPASISQAL